MVKSADVAHDYLNDYFSDLKSGKENFDLEIVFNSMNSYVLLKDFDKVEELIGYSLKFFVKEGYFVDFDRDKIAPYLFLKYLIKYVHTRLKVASGLVLGEVKYDVLSKKKVREYVKIVSKILKFADKKFNDTYLLVSSLHSDDRFLLEDNVVLLSLLEEIFEIFNYYGENKVADFAFMLKGKLELGVNRYFWYPKYNVLISEFDMDGTYYECLLDECLDANYHYLFDEKLVSDKVSEVVLGKKFSKNYLEVLLALGFLKLKNKKKFDLIMKEKKEEFLKFAEYKSDKETFLKLKDVSKSINQDRVLNAERMGKSNDYLFEVGNCNVVNLFVRLFEK